MVKRILELFEKMEPLCAEILDLMPDQYKNHDIIKGKGWRRDHELRQRIRELWGKGDDVTAGWIEVYYRAHFLPDDLRTLAADIDDRVRSKAARLARLGKTFQTPPASAPADPTCTISPGS